MPSKITITADVRQYLETAIWSSGEPDGGPPYDHDYDVSHFTDTALRRATEDVEIFGRLIEERGIEIDASMVSVHPDFRSDGSGGFYSMIAHNFWLTRNGHGCGFWDGRFPEPAAAQLTALAAEFGGCDLDFSHDPDEDTREIEISGGTLPRDSHVHDPNVDLRRYILGSYSHDGGYAWESGEISWETLISNDGGYAWESGEISWETLISNKGPDARSDLGMLPIDGVCIDRAALSARGSADAVRRVR